MGPAQHCAPQPSPGAPAPWDAPSGSSPQWRHLVDTCGAGTSVTSSFCGPPHGVLCGSPTHIPSWTAAPQGHRSLT